MITQKIIVYTAGITISLKKRGVILVSLNEQIQLVTRNLFRKDACNFHHDSHEQATKLAQKLMWNLEIIIVIIPILDDAITSLQQRFTDGQDIIMNGMALLPSYIIAKSDWKTTLQPFLEFYLDEVPSCHAADSELKLWSEMWRDH